MSRLPILVIIALLGLRTGYASDASSSVLSRDVPFVPMVVMDEIAGTRTQVWSWKWKELDSSQYTAEIQQQIADDIKTSTASAKGLPKWYEASTKLILVLKNPTRPLIYFVLVPASATHGSLDANIVYAYDTEKKVLVFKTYADPES